jgi:hypothetical protein
MAGWAYDLQLHRLAVELDGPDFLQQSVDARRRGCSRGGAYEVDADGGDVGLCVGVVGEPQEQARLADTGVTDEQQLEEIVVSGIVSAAGGAESGRGIQRASSSSSQQSIGRGSPGRRESWGLDGGKARWIL